MCVFVIIFVGDFLRSDINLNGHIKLGKRVTTTPWKSTTRKTPTSLRADRHRRKVAGSLAVFHELNWGWFNFSVEYCELEFGKTFYNDFILRISILNDQSLTSQFNDPFSWIILLFHEKFYNCLYIFPVTSSVRRSSREGKERKSKKADWKITSFVDGTFYTRHKVALCQMTRIFFGRGNLQNHSQHSPSSTVWKSIS